MIFEMIARIQVYIHVRKGVEVDLKPEMPGDIMLLIKAYQIADAWLNAHNCKSRMI